MFNVWCCHPGEPAPGELPLSPDSPGIVVGEKDRLAPDRDLLREAARPPQAPDGSLKGGVPQFAPVHRLDHLVQGGEVHLSLVLVEDLLYFFL